MASFSAAVDATTGTIVPGALVVVGSLGATVATDFLKNNVYDIPYRGGDALYPVVAIFAIQWLMGSRGNSINAVDLVSFGMMASSVSEVANAYGLV
jgi:hypothetical protein